MATLILSHVVDNKPVLRQQTGAQTTSRASTRVQRTGHVSTSETGIRCTETGGVAWRQKELEGIWQ